MNIPEAHAVLYLYFNCVGDCAYVAHVKANIVGGHALAISLEFGDHSSQDISQGLVRLTSVVFPVHLLLLYMRVIVCGFSTLADSCFRSHLALIITSQGAQFRVPTHQRYVNMLFCQEVESLHFNRALYTLGMNLLPEVV